MGPRNRREPQANKIEQVNLHGNIAPNRNIGNKRSYIALVVIAVAVIWVGLILTTGRIPPKLSATT